MWSPCDRFGAGLLLTLVVSPMSACGGPASALTDPRPVPVAVVAPQPSAPTPSHDLLPGSDAAAIAARTGVPGDVRLTSRAGDLTITRAGTVVDGMDLAGCITIRADDVTIRNSRIWCASSISGMAVATNGSYRNLLVEDSEIDGGGGVDIGVGWQNVTLRRVEITGVTDGVRAGSNTVLEDSWVHDLTRRGDLHPDAVQSTGGAGIRIVGNVLDPRNTGTGDPGNAAVMLGSETTSVLSDVLIEGNQLGGGNFTVNIRGDSAAAGILLRGNVFSGDATYGSVRAPASTDVDPDNVLATSGVTVPVVRSS